MMFPRKMPSFFNSLSSRREDPDSSESESMRRRTDLVQGRNGVAETELQAARRGARKKNVINDVWPEVVLRRQPSKKGSGRGGTIKSPSSQEYEEVEGSGIEDGASSRRKRKDIEKLLDLSQQRNRALKEEVTVLRERSKTVEENSRTVENWNRFLKERVRGLEENISKLAEEHRTFEERSRPLEEQKREFHKESRELSEQRKALQDRLRVLEEQNQALVEQNYALEERSIRQAKEIESNKIELRRAKSQSHQTAVLLETRTAELQGTQTFLTKADSVSGADVIRMAKGLNAEILQTAAFMADSFEYDDGKRAVSSEADFEARHYIGSTMVHLLETTKHGEDPTLIQIAIQACLALFSAWIASSWVFDQTRNEKFLNDICASVQQGEAQAVSGRWRAITRFHAQHMLGNETALVARLTSDIAAALVFILEVAGCNETEVRDTVVSRFDGKISTIVALALRMNRVMGQEITSCDLTTAIVRAGDTFDPKIMIDAYGEDTLEHRYSAERVMCTTDMGLRRVEKLLRGSEVEVVEITLLKPQVVLDSVTRSVAHE